MTEVEEELEGKVLARIMLDCKLPNTGMQSGLLNVLDCSDSGKNKYYVYKAMVG